MSSRFFRHGDTSSEESSTEEEELYSDSDEEEQDLDQEDSDKDSDEDEDEGDESDSDSDAGKKGANKFLKDASSESEDSDDGEREKVKSAKDKRIDELEATIKLIENGQKNNDWNLIATEFDKLNRQVVKIKESGITPKVYIKAIAELETFMLETLEKQKVTPKNMSATNARGLNAVKQRVKKNNRDYQAQIDEYREDKFVYMMSSDEEEEEEDPLPAKLKKPKSVAFDETPADDEDTPYETVGKGGKTVQYTAESIFKHLRAILDSRGKKNTDRFEQIKTMEKLHEVAVTPYQRIRVLITLVSARFDLGSWHCSYAP